MFKTSRLFVAPFCLLLAVGCGSAEQEYAQGQIVEETKTQRVRAFLEEVARTGQPSSAMESLPDDIAALKEEGVTNADQLKQEAEALKAARNPAQIKKLASQLLAKLPSQPATPPAP